MEFKLWGQILELNCYYIIILGYYIQPTWNYIFITFYNIVYIFRQCPASIYRNVSAYGLDKSHRNLYWGQAGAR